MPGEFERSLDPVPNPDKFYYARRGFDYVGHDEGHLDREVIFKLDPVVTFDRHSKMIRLGYIAEVDPQLISKQRWSECGTCGARFMSMGSRDEHVRTRHVRPEAPKAPALSEMSPEEKQRIVNEPLQHERLNVGEGRGTYREDGPTLVSGAMDPEMQKVEQQEKQIERDAPIFWTNTEASRKAGENVYGVQQPKTASPKKSVQNKPAPKQKPIPAKRVKRSSAEALRR